ncbi:MAG: NAD(P)/FAD-dependent oxidoreductase [Myxococcota bacterium]|jgi:flavin-dependent dehydrogenase/NAD-dependent dihydropyrimidine dehydrogenase PreA subunit|nr:NAD(P)/FAD-dependent oxidoreductase [Myxococcota bacterium]
MFENAVLLDTERCNGCGACVRTCPQMVFESDPPKVRLAHPQRCFGCMACEEDCAQQAITVHRMARGQKLADLPQPALGADPEQCYDLIVVGAGPAGLGAAMRARRLGLSVLVLERLPSPRRAHHPDGGLVFSAPDISPMLERPDGLHLQRFDLTIPTALIRDRFSDFVFMGPEGLATKASRGKAIFPYIDKNELVALFVERATELGALICWNTRVHGIERDADATMLVQHSVGQTLRARLVICAEGSTGRLAQRFGAPVNEPGGAWSYAAMVQLDPRSDAPGELGFLAGPIAGSPDGLPFLSFWANGKDHVELAAGPLQQHKARQHERPLEEYLGGLARDDQRISARLGAPVDLQQRRFLDGCRIFARRLPKSATSEGLIAVGDALATCGMCTTVAAMRTGDLAAEVAAVALRQNDTSRAALAPFDQQVFKLSMMQGLKWMHELLIEAPLKLSQDDLRALFEMLQHLDLSRLMGGHAVWPLLRFYGRNLFAMMRRPDLRPYLVPR